MIQSLNYNPNRQGPLNKAYRMVSSGGNSLRVEWHKPIDTDALTIIFLHEGLGSITQWKDIPVTLGKHLDCGLLIYDRFGYGGSTCLPEPYKRPLNTMEIEANNTLPDLLDSFNINNAVLFGHSDGGTIALLAAATGDKRIKGAVTIAAHVFVESKSIESIKSIRREWKSGDLRSRLEKHHGDNADGAFLGWANLWLDPDFSAFNICEQLSEITCPIMAIQGTNDEYGTLQQINSIKDNVSGLVETIVLPGCGHSPHLEKKNVVVRKIIKFLNTIICR